MGGFQPWRLEVSDGKPVYTKLSVSSGVNLLRSNSCSSAYNACDKLVSRPHVDRAYLLCCLLLNFDFASVDNRCKICIGP